MHLPGSFAACNYHRSEIMQPLGARKGDAPDSSAQRICRTVEGGNLHHPVASSIEACGLQVQQNRHRIPRVLGGRPRAERFRVEQAVSPATLQGLSCQPPAVVRQGAVLRDAALLSRACGAAAALRHVG